MTLTVTDKSGVTKSLTKPVTVTALPPAVAEDDFDQNQTNGWGTADTGGAWTIGTGTASNYTVSGGVGKIEPVVGRAPVRSIALNGVSSHQHRGARRDQPGQGRHRRRHLRHRPAAGAWAATTTSPTPGSPEPTGPCELRLGRSVGTTRDHPADA